MHKERLEQMVTMLRNLPEEKFDISGWSCGTTACAVGHACATPVFQAQGLLLRQDFDGVMPAYGESDGWRAVGEFFELDIDDAEHLFYSAMYPNYGCTKPFEVADRIEAFIAA